MLEEKKFKERLASLRMNKGVSARDMSLSLGFSEGYINKMENGNSLPSMMCFFYICEYFGITPKEFFDYETSDPVKSDELKAAVEKLSPKQAEHLLAVVRDITER